MNCTFERESDKRKITDLTLYDEFSAKHKCVQINYDTNLNELVKTVGEGDAWLHGYGILVYMPPKSSFRFSITDNSAKIVFENMYNNYIYLGQKSEIALSRTVQTALGQPHSDCSQVEDYRQVNCRDECFNKKMTEICECAYPRECGPFSEND